ncbi:hypothetical protein BCR36DRAFT_129170 [Piromyces finnis]|uniref:Uncharacterized protein n=1 Tax=Piromyces finnis TaxID=1754191 RepID=A0A1Y1V175_9FUNG|nr:hypothetical protein BCR36DRAFT_129170 [Piromyces finnis]|eukprot:ORX44388.1 hypothetical protein BCR36DRAFT_129170 [Piromyces finnis]
MVSIQSPVNKKYPLSFNYINIKSNDKKAIKKALKINKIKKRNKHMLFEMYKSDNDFVGKTEENFSQLKRNAYSFSQCEEDVIPKTQNNIERGLRRSESLMSESSYYKISETYPTDKKEENDSFDFQYGTLFENEKVKVCVSNFLSNWSTFISDIDGGNSIKEQNENANEEKNKFSTSFTQETVLNNSGYLTPTSQKDDECFYESFTALEKNEVLSENEVSTEEEEEIFIRNSPIVIDDIDDICPFDNDLNEDERIRNILNSEVLPNDYIGKIPYIPEKPIGSFGRLMRKYRF